MIRPIAAVVLTLVLAGCAKATPEQAVIDDAVRALGGRSRVEAVKTLTQRGHGLLGNIGQDMRPDTFGQTFTLTGVTRRVDFAAERMRTEQTRTPDFLYFQGPEPRQQVLALDGQVAFDVAPDGAAARLSDAAARDRRLERYQHPLAILRLASSPGAALTNARTEEGQRLVDVATPDGVTLTLAIDGATRLPARVYWRMGHPNLGDVIVEAHFENYQAVGGLQLPARQTITVDGLRASDYVWDAQALDENVGDELAAPAEVAAGPAPMPPVPQVTVEAVAPGVWWLAGQSHHSAVVELSDHLVLIEAPQSEARTLAVIAKARELNPKKPLTQVINSHHHFDHSAGIRAAIAEGLEVITHEANRAYFDFVSARPFTIAPDELARQPRPMKITTVSDPLTLGDAARSIVLYPIDGNPHADTLLMAYLPKERLLVEADAYTPGVAYQPYAANLLENIQRRKLSVDRIVPLHGTIAPFSDLVKAVTP